MKNCVRALTAAVLLTARLGAQSSVPSRPQSSPATNVAIVPFASTDNGFIFLRAQVDDHAGFFVLDTGSPFVILNPTFLPADISHTANVLPADSGGGFTGTFVPHHEFWDRPGTNVHSVTVGDMTASLDTNPMTRPTTWGTNAVYMQHPILGIGAAALGAPMVGFLGVEALAPFETIVDYPRRRVIFIRLDAKGNPLASPPGLRLTNVLPMPRMSEGMHFGARDWTVGGITDTNTYELDTGAPMSSMSSDVERAWLSHLSPAPDDAYLLQPNERWGTSLRVLDHFTLGGVTYDRLPFANARESFPGIDVGLLGTPFLSRVGVVGFNFRTRQFMTYGADSSATASNAVAKRQRPKGFPFRNDIHAYADTAQVVLTEDMLRKMNAMTRAFLSNASEQATFAFPSIVTLPAIHVPKLVNRPHPGPVVVPDMVKLDAQVPGFAAYFRDAGLTSREFMQWYPSLMTAVATSRVNAVINGVNTPIDTSTVVGRNAELVRTHQDELGDISKMIPVFDIMLRAQPKPQTTQSGH